MRNVSLIRAVICTMTIFASIAFPTVQAKSSVTPEEARAIAKEAYIYGNPLADSYRILYGTFVDQKNQEYKGPRNQIHNIARVYTSDDKAVQTPNSDTPYSWLGLDLRTEPYVLTVPPIEKERYFSIQLIELYTHNFDYIGSRMTGNDGGNFLIVGPNWHGDAPKGITKVIRSETELMIAVYRTQLFNPGDIEQVKAIQAKYELQSLSAFLGKPAPKAAPAINFIKPLTRDELTKSPKIFQQLNFVLQFCPTHPDRKRKELTTNYDATFIGVELPKDVSAALGIVISESCMQTGRSRCENRSMVTQPTDHGPAPYSCRVKGRGAGIEFGVGEENPEV